MRKSLLGVSMCLGLAVSGCKEDQPRMPIVKLCDYVQPIPDDPTKDYLNCFLTDENATFVVRIPILNIPVIPETSRDKVVCTTLNDVTALRVFAEATQYWINLNCRDR